MHPPEERNRREALLALGVWVSLIRGGMEEASLAAPNDGQFALTGLHGWPDLVNSRVGRQDRSMAVVLCDGPTTGFGTSCKAVGRTC